MKSCLSVLAVAAATCAAAFSATTPNIVIIYMDDLGYADIGSFGAKGYATPNLDKMAVEGTRFTSFYTAQAVRSASRCALMTGCYPNRVGISGALGPHSKTGLSPDETTLAEICKQKGYATAVFGKTDESLELPRSYRTLNGRPGGTDRKGTGRRPSGKIEGEAEYPSSFPLKEDATRPSDS